MLIAGTHLEPGDEILLRLRSDLDPDMFGSGWRIGTVTTIGTDIIADEPVFRLDDGGPAIYAEHVDFVSRIRSAIRR